jgi:P27 family predicted phage terminase small subunit
MGRRGPPKQPLELKLLNGTYRRDRDGDLAERVVVLGEPKKPEDLPPEASAFWEQWVPRLVELGIAKDVDAPALEQMCFWWARSKELRQVLQKISRAVLTKEYFRTQVLAAQADKSFNNIASRFGLTPADRTRLRNELPPISTVRRRVRG